MHKAACLAVLSATAFVGCTGVRTNGARPISNTAEPPATTTAPPASATAPPASAGPTASVGPHTPSGQSAPAPAKISAAPASAGPSSAVTSPPGDDKSSSPAPRPKVSAAPTAKNKSAAAAKGPARAPAGAPATASSTAKPQLDFQSLVQRLRETSAIGVFTKLSIKNEVDDLLKSFRGYYAGQVPPSLDELRQRYDGLLLKVVSLVQNDDAALASAISASRGAIWDRLSNKASFQAL